MIKNKKGDIAITILVLGVITLCAIALLSFYLVGKKEADKIDRVFYLQGVYNTAESVRYSGVDLYKNYETDNIKIGYTERNKDEGKPGVYEINGEFLRGDLKIKYNLESREP